MSSCAPLLKNNPPCCTFLHMQENDNFFSYYQGLQKWLVPNVIVQNLYQSPGLPWWFPTANEQHAKCAWVGMYLIWNIIDLQVSQSTLNVPCEIQITRLSPSLQRTYSLTIFLIGITGLIIMLFLWFWDHSYMHANSLISPFYNSPWVSALLIFSNN